MAQDSAQEKTEDATPRRRQEARQKGTVTRSIDLTQALVVLAIMVALPHSAMALGQAMLEGVHVGIRDVPMDLNPNTITDKIGTLMVPMVLAILPLVAAAMAVGVAANFAQVGFVLSLETLNPTLNKLNPLNGIKRLFSAISLVDGIKAIGKSALFGYLAYAQIAGHWDQLLHLGHQPIGATLILLGSILQTIFSHIAIAWLAIAALDYFFQRKQVDKQLRMTKEEVKQEFKDMEQSAELKMAMAQRRRKLTKGRMMAAVKTADAVITNPTHFAVAIKYDPKTMHAPQVVAKGADYIAQKIREEAAKHRVPLVPNAPLARQLYKKCDVGDFVPRDLFQAVAEVLAYVYSTLKRVPKP